VRCESERI